jgi:hypothetical protein
VKGEQQSRRKSGREKERKKETGGSTESGSFLIAKIGSRCGERTKEVRNGKVKEEKKMYRQGDCGGGRRIKKSKE